MNAADILERAADLLEPAGAWTQDAEARDADGNDIDVFPMGEVEHEAVCFCAAGAIHRVSRVHYTRCPGHQFLTGIVGFIPDWNDAPERTQAEVVQTLRTAAELAKEQSS